MDTPMPEATQDHTAARSTMDTLDEMDQELERLIDQYAVQAHALGRLSLRIRAHQELRRRRTAGVEGVGRKGRGRPWTSDLRLAVLFRQIAPLIEPYSMKREAPRAPESAPGATQTTTETET